MRDEGTFKYLRELMALPFLPSLEIPAMFKSLKEDATSSVLRELTKDIENQWFKSPIFTPNDWSVYNQPTMTNNDIEGTFILKIEWQIKQDVIRLKYAKTSYVFPSRLLRSVLILTFPGWHHVLNRRATGRHLLFYELIELLHREAKLVDNQIQLVSNQKLMSIQRRANRQLQSKVFGLWEEYKNGETTAAQLLKSMSRLNGPTSAE